MTPIRRHDVHVCLVSEQATPNITPALDPAIRPSRVALVVSPDMVQRADWLQGVLRGRGVETVRWAVEDAWDIAGLQTRIREFVVGERSSDVVLNATGGTKPMSIAAYEVFRELGRPIFYVHPELDRLIWLHPSGQEPHQLADRIKLDDFLAAHGATVRKTIRAGQSSERFGQLSEAMIAGIEQYARPLATLNWLAHRARDTLASPELNSSQSTDADLAELVGIFERAGLLWREGNRLRFPNETARFLANGGWLELHVYDTLFELRPAIPAIHDFARGVIVERSAPGGKVENELDAALLCRNRLYIIECKTRRLENDRRDSELGPEALFKLDTLGDLLGGLRATAMLVSYQKLTKATRRRALDLRIKTCCGADLKRLRNLLREWLSASP